MSCITHPHNHFSFPRLSKAISNGGIDQVEAARVLGAGLVVTLRRVVEGAPRVEKFNEARLAAAVTVTVSGFRDCAATGLVMSARRKTKTRPVNPKRRINSTISPALRLD
jgi:hypothetical protein